MSLVPMSNNAIFCKSEDSLFECFTALQQRVMTLVLTNMHDGAGWNRRSLWECTYLGINQGRYVIALLYAEREIHPLPARAMLSVVLAGGVAWIPLFPTALHVLPLLASTHPYLEHLQLIRGFEAALDCGVPAMG